MCTQAGPYSACVRAQVPASRFEAESIMVAARFVMGRFIASGSSCTDLTEADVFPFEWQRFLGNMPLCAQNMIQESDITKFAIKTRKGSALKTGKAMFDFVAVRADGQLLRIHLSSTKVDVCYLDPQDSSPWYKGELTRSAQHTGGLAAGSGLLNVRCTVAGLRSLNDVIGRPAARTFLAGLSIQDGTVDLTDGVVFAWPRWFAHMPKEAQEQVVGAGLVRISGVNPGDLPFFLVERIDGTAAKLYPDNPLRIEEERGFEFEL